MIPRRLEGKRPDYEELYCRVGQMFGWTFDEIDAMPFPRFFMACRANPPVVRMVT